MTERPIQFNAEMIRAILSGAKTQTRRVLGKRVQPTPGILETGYDVADLNPSRVGSQPTLVYDDNPWEAIRSPYGTPGDELWVRETWGATIPESESSRQWIKKHPHLVVEDAAPDDLGWYAEFIVYRASCPGFEWTDDDGFDDYREDGSARSHWKPSIHMPRWASRIQLRVTDVRVERVQEITDADARAEGVMTLPDTLMQDAARQAAADGLSACEATHYFRQLWNQINGGRGFGWDENPYVWVVAFERIRP